MFGVVIHSAKIFDEVVGQKRQLLVLIRSFEQCTTLSSDSLRTTDLLGIGGLLGNVFEVASLSNPNEELLEVLVDASSASLNAAVADRGFLSLAASERLAFREFGLSIGLQLLPFAKATFEKAAGSDGTSAKNIARKMEHIIRKHMSHATTIVE